MDSSRERDAAFKVWKPDEGELALPLLPSACLACEPRDAPRAAEPGGKPQKA